MGTASVVGSVDSGAGIDGVSITPDVTPGGDGRGADAEVSASARPPWDQPASAEVASIASGVVLAS